MDFSKKMVVTIATAFSISVISSAIFADNIAQQKNIFIQKLVQQDHFNRAQVTGLLNSLHKDPRVIAAMTKPFEKKPWTFYRDFFITQQRITLGAAYLEKYHTPLMQMQKKYGIPASIITAIIGIETEYGTHLGNYSVLNTLYTLGFYYPPRESFFRGELEQYLLLTRANHLNPSQEKGSYAGAFGIPQFMPSSYRNYGVAYHAGHSINLYKNKDAIASVANYFHRNGWQANQPIARLLPSKQANYNHQRASRLALPLQNTMQYWATYHNFNVIMSYNHNVVYAMAVYQLSQAIERQYDNNVEQLRKTASRAAPSSKKMA